MGNQNSPLSGPVARLGVVGISVLTVMTAPAAAQGMGGGWEPTLGHLVRTLVHLIGIVGGFVIIYFANQVRQETSGSTMATISNYVIVGTALFILVFLGMEANHLLGVDLWYFAEGLALTQTWYMIALAGMMLLYMLGFKQLVESVGA